MGLVCVFGRKTQPLVAGVVSELLALTEPVDWHRQPVVQRGVGEEAQQ